MGATSQITVSTVLERKNPGLPVFVVVQGSFIASWKLAETTVIEGTANGHAFGRRNIKAWGKGSDNWFLEFTTPFCRAAGLNVGDSISLQLRVADVSLPPELETLLLTSKALTQSWAKLTAAQRRDASEHVRAAKSLAARKRRAEAVVGKLGPS
jgi:hypothetical protein